jgi:hypothetical protein
MGFVSGRIFREFGIPIAAQRALIGFSGRVFSKFGIPIVGACLRNAPIAEAILRGIHA